MTMHPPVRKERSGWRDQGISERHREWGWNVPAVDLDFVLLEFDNGKAVAIAEYKNEHAPPVDSSGRTFQALRDLADRAGLLFIYVRYASDYSWYRVSAQNRIALAALNVSSHRPVQMTEPEWVEFLHRTRKDFRSYRTDPALKYFEFMRSFGCLACASFTDVGTLNLAALLEELPGSASLLEQLGRWGTVPVCAGCRDRLPAEGVELFGGWELLTANAAVLMAQYLGKGQ